MKRRVVGKKFPAKRNVGTKAAKVPRKGEEAVPPIKGQVKPDERFVTVDEQKKPLKGRRGNKPPAKGFGKSPPQRKVKGGY